MNSVVYPALQRLISSFDQAQSVTLEVSQMIQAAEEEAAHQFQIAGVTNQSQATSATTQAQNDAGNTQPTGPDTSDGFTVGPPTPPSINHDDGFTEFCAVNGGHADCSPDASFSDYTNRTKYEALLRGAQAAGHLDDGTETYAHYLYGDGEDWHFDYNEFITEDANGKIAADNLLIEAQRNAEIIGQGREQFRISSEAYPIGGGDPRFPYPSTENWQKAIGGHHVWTNADVTVTTNDAGERIYTMTLTYHGEDRYNFNPGQADEASGLLDRENGRFEVLGWADPFMSYGESQRTVTWVEGDVPNSQIGEDTPIRRTDRGVDRRGEIRDR